MARRPRRPRRIRRRDRRPTDRREALLAALAAEMVPYSPEQLVEMANREYAWCEAEMKKAAREMGLRRRLEGGRREGEDPARRAGRAAQARPRPGPGGDRLPAGQGPRDRPAAGRRDVADGHDEPGAAAVQPVLHRRGSHQRRLPDRHHVARAEAPGPARQQHPLLARDRPPRADPRPPPPAVHDPALPAAAAGVRHAVLDRGVGRLLGDGAVREGSSPAGPRTGSACCSGGCTAVPA